MDAKTTGIVAYLTWVGLLIAFLAGDKEDASAKVHLNNSLVCMLFALLVLVPIVGWIWSICVFVFLIMGLVSAIKGEAKEVPLIGKIHIIK